MSIHILSVGQCGFDHGNLARFLTRTVAARTAAAATADEALQMLAQGSYQLVLVNRIIDGDGSSGIDLIKQLRAQPGCPPVMLVSNLPAAQAAAVAAGAVEGFGKSTMDYPDTAQRLKALFPGTQERV